MTPRDGRIRTKNSEEEKLSQDLDSRGYKVGRSGWGEEAHRKPPSPTYQVSSGSLKVEVSVSSFAFNVQSRH